jgi:hypothetical protein
MYSINYSKEIRLKVLFEDHIWKWTAEDWKANSDAKNIFGEDHGARGRRTRKYVWDKLRESSFQNIDRDVLPGPLKYYS